MPSDATNMPWVPNVRKTDGPVYLSIAEAIEIDIRNGVLKPGQRLPPQRALADALEIDFTTVSRAYAAAGKKNLVEGRVGQGTYVRELFQAGREPNQSTRDRAVDMSMNMPPRFNDPALVQQMWSGFYDLGLEQGDKFLMQYQRPGGSEADRDAAQMWLKDQFGLRQAARVVLCNGVQGALLSILSLHVRPGDTICHEEVTFPGFLAVAKYLDLNLAPVKMDDEGIIPESLAEVCSTHKPTALYTIPTLHNPTTATVPKDRREQIADIAAEHELTLLEDDAYGALADNAPPPVYEFAPERTWHICSTSKCLAPSLRVCFVTPPEGESAEGLKRAIRANGGVVSPISAGLATTWITSGLSSKVTAAIRDETLNRQKAFSDVLPDVPVRPGAYHVWMTLSAEISATEFAFNQRDNGIGIVPGRAFTTGPAPNAVRIALGSSESNKELRADLRRLADAMKHPDENSWMVV